MWGSIPPETQRRSQLPIHTSSAEISGRLSRLIRKLFVVLNVRMDDFEVVEPRNRTILPSAPALANTPRLTSGRAKEALVLAITISLPLARNYSLQGPIYDHLKSAAYEMN